MTNFDANTWMAVHLIQIDRTLQDAERLIRESLYAVRHNEQETTIAYEWCEQLRCSELERMANG